MRLISVILLSGLAGAVVAYLVILAELYFLVSFFAKDSVAGMLLVPQFRESLKFYVLPSAVLLNGVILAIRYYLNTKNDVWDEQREKWIFYGAEHGISVMFVPFICWTVAFLIFFFLPSSWVGIVVLIFSCLLIYSLPCAIGGIISLRWLCYLRGRCLAKSEVGQKF